MPAGGNHAGLDEDLLELMIQEISEKILRRCRTQFILVNQIVER